MRIQYAFDDKIYRLEENLQEKWGEDWKKKIFEIVSTNVLMQVHPQGMKGPQARSYNRILIQLDLARKDFIEVETAEAEFLRTIFFHENAAVLPGQVGVFVKMQDAITAGFAAQETSAQ